MGSKHKILLIILLIISILTGCKKEDIKEPANNHMDFSDPLIVEKGEENTEIIIKGIPSPLSGIYADEEKINRRVVAVMFDNHPKARWQAGLKDAEIVYEFPVEAPYTRYLGLFLINDPESIGPIRSSRPYFVTKVLEYDAVYVRVGGSEQAKKDIIQLKIADIDGLSSSSKIFWREGSKKMPHNLYSSMGVIRKIQEERGYKMNGDIPCFKFNEEDKDIDGYRAMEIKIDYKQNNTTSYIYNKDEKIYYRQKDGKDHIDEIDQSNIIAKNIIIQQVNTKVIDNEGRLQIDLIGEGEGKFFTNGSGMDIKWVKNDRKGKTIYYDKDGQEIAFNPGITWVQIVNSNLEITIK